MLRITIRNASRSAMEGMEFSNFVFERKNAPCAAADLCGI